VENDLPDESFWYSFLLLAILLNKLREITLTGILHEKIEVVLVIVEHARNKLDDVAMVKRGQNADLVDGVVSLIFAHSEAADLR